MKHTPRTTRTAALVAGVLALTGCVTIAGAPTADTLANGEGIVILSVTGNTARVGQFDTLNLRRVASGDEYVPNTTVILRQAARGLARDTNVFLAAVAPGEYELDCLAVDQTSLSFGEGTRRLLGRVVVKPGKVHDLGRIVITALNTKVLVGRSALVTSNAELVRRFSPDHAKLFDGPVDPGWAKPRNADDKVEEYALANPVGADGLMEVGNGVVAAGSRLGSILLRGSSGRWSAVRTGGLESLLSVMPLPRSLGLLAAVGEFDAIAVVDAAGKVRRVGAGNLPPGNLLLVDGDPKTGWVVVHQAGATATVYRSLQLEDGDWQPLRTTTIGTSLWTGKDHLWTWRTARGFAYALTDGTLSFYDRTSGTFTDRHGPEGATLLAIGPSAPGVLGAVTRGFLPSSWLSRDDGATWQELKTPFTGKAAPPRVTPGGPLLVQAGSFVDGDLLRSTDGGASWGKVMEHVDIKAAVFVTPGTGVFVVESGSGSYGLAAIYHSADDGKTWRPELSNFDRAAYDAEQKRK